jgi:hypothetical protein
MAEETLPPNLQNVLDQKSLKWIFCGMSLRIPLSYNSLTFIFASCAGGKGGVGTPALVFLECGSIIIRPRPCPRA